MYQSRQIMGKICPNLSKKKSSFPTTMHTKTKRIFFGWQIDIIPLVYQVCCLKIGLDSRDVSYTVREAAKKLFFFNGRPLRGGGRAIFWIFFSMAKFRLPLAREGKGGKTLMALPLKERVFFCGFPKRKILLSGLGLSPPPVRSSPEEIFFAAILLKTYMS